VRALDQAVPARNRRQASGVRGGYEKFQTDPHFKDYILFHEYFHGDNGRGCGASHQTGWTGLIANLIAQLVAEGGMAARPVCTERVKPGAPSPPRLHT
jgi:hypothetical protein